MRTIPVAYLLWFFFGLVGVHRFYCGRIGTGLLWAFTGGLAGIGWLIDAFLIPDMVRESNAEYLSCFRAYGTPDPMPMAHPMVREYPPSTAPPQTPFGIATGHRIVFCTQCGGPMQVPRDAVGAAYACPRCRTVLEIPA
ncbi:MAG: NINE protein [Phycisphaerales bacterium]|nr:NINE protein [Phycisphaerales bacterium]